jgi:hypothetical protein
MATDAPVEENRPDGGYAVTLVIRSSNEHHLQPPLELPDGIQAVVGGPEVVLTVPVRAPKRGVGPRGCQDDGNGPATGAGVDI